MTISAPFVVAIVAGAHFLSDTVVSFFVMLIVTDVLYHYLVFRESDRDKSVARDGVLAPVASGVPSLESAQSD